jgi:hypothetical protein
MLSIDLVEGRKYANASKIEQRVKPSNAGKKSWDDGSGISV